MKTDYSFKLLAVIVFAGVIIAVITPGHALPRADGDTYSPEAAHAAGQTE